MNTWVEINLPWSRNETVAVEANKLRKRAEKLYAKAYAKAEAELGQTLVQARATLDVVRMAALRKKQPDANDDNLLFSHDLDSIKKKYPILDVNLLKTPPDCCDVNWLMEIKAKVKRNPIAVALAEYYHYKYRYDVLTDCTQECQEAFELDQAANAMLRAGAFHTHLGSHEMCRPGVLLEVKHGNAIKQLLIGHMGPAGGPAEWEMGEQVLEATDMVLRAKVVWEAP